MNSRAAILPTLAVALAACAADMPDMPPGLGDPVSNAEFEILDGTGTDWHRGDRLRLSDLEGSPVVLDFWATWCVPCQRQHRYLTRLKDQYGDGLTIIAVLYNDAPENVQPWLDEHGHTYPAVVDVGGELAREFWVNSLPTFVLLTPDRRLSWSYLGPSSENPYTSDSVVVRLDEMLGA